MLVMWTTEYPADPIRELVCSQQTLGFYDLALAVYPLGLYGVKPRTLLGQKAAYDPHSAAAVLDTAIVLAEPAPDLLGDVPGGVVPDQKHDLLSTRFELLQAPPEKLRRYRTHRPAVDESQPRLIDLWKVESVAGDGLRLGIVFGERPLDEAKGLALLGPTVQRGQCQLAPPALVTEANRPRFGVGLRHAHQPVASEASLFSFVQGVGGGDPPLGPHPSHAQKASQSGPHGLPGDSPPGESLFESGLGRHLQGPKARAVSELPRTAMEHLPQGLGAVFVEGGAAGALWARGARLKSTQAPLVEVVDGVPERLGAASQTPSDLGRGLSTRTCQKNLASTQNKGVFGAQPGFQ